MEILLWRVSGLSSHFCQRSSDKNRNRVYATCFVFQEKSFAQPLRRYQMVYVFDLTPRTTRSLLQGPETCRYSHWGRVVYNREQVTVPVNRVLSPRIHSAHRDFTTETSRSFIVIYLQLQKGSKDTALPNFSSLRHTPYPMYKCL